LPARLSAAIANGYRIHGELIFHVPLFPRHPEHAEREGRFLAWKSSTRTRAISKTGCWPKHLITHLSVVAVPLTEPEFWREVSLVTVRGRPYSPALGALIQISMKMKWLGNPAHALQSLADDVPDQEGAS